VQAFATADFSGEPLAQGFVTNLTSITNTHVVTANARLAGLPLGTCFIRAYIDSNGNFEKDDWESWGYAKEPVAIAAGRMTSVPAVWIEDADTDTDWLPDAWEYVRNGSLATDNATVDKNGQIVMKTTTYTSVTNGTANFSTFLSGASLTLFENLSAATLLLDLGSSTTSTTVDAIRELVEKKIVPSTFRITSMVLDSGAQKVRLTIEADVTDSIAGQMLSPVYELPRTSSATVKVYKKDNLAAATWGDPVATAPVTLTPPLLSEEFEIDLSTLVPPIDFSSGFFKVEIE
jgi:hypothetical protein